MNETILTPAVLLKSGLIVTTLRPNRHDTVLYNLAREGVDLDNCLAGFLTSKGRFVNRKEAAEVAFKSGQITQKASSLISEDLW